MASKWRAPPPQTRRADVAHPASRPAGLQRLPSTSSCLLLRWPDVHTCAAPHRLLTCPESVILFAPHRSFAPLRVPVPCPAVHRCAPLPSTPFHSCSLSRLGTPASLHVVHPSAMLFPCPARSHGPILHGHTSAQPVNFCPRSPVGAAPSCSDGGPDERRVVSKFSVKPLCALLRLGRYRLAGAWWQLSGDWRQLSPAWRPHAGGAS